MNGSENAGSEHIADCLTELQAARRLVEAAGETLSREAGRHAILAAKESLDRAFGALAAAAHNGKWFREGNDSDQEALWTAFPS